MAVRAFDKEIRLYLRIQTGTFDCDPVTGFHCLKQACGDTFGARGNLRGNILGRVQAAAWVEAATAAELRSTLDLLDPVRSDVDNHATSSTNSQMV